MVLTYLGGAAGVLAFLLAFYLARSFPRELVRASGSHHRTSGDIPEHWRMPPRPDGPVDRERRPELVLAFPELGRGSRPREHDVFVLGVLGENLSGVEVLDDLTADHRGEHEYANW
jgi:hypothetical protein